MIQHSPRINPAWPEPFNDPKAWRVFREEFRAVATAIIPLAPSGRDDYRPWQPEDRRALARLLADGEGMTWCAGHFGRSRSSVASEVSNWGGSKAEYIARFGTPA